jgi:hypothetical protein
MSNYLSEEIRRFRQRARDCAQQAAAQTDPKLKQDFLNLEESWLFMARSYAYHEGQSGLSDETMRIDPISAANPHNA